MREGAQAVAKLVITLAVMVFFLFPVYWLVTTAFKPGSDWFRWPPMIIPQALTLDNFTGGGSGIYGGGGGTTAIENIVPYLRNSVVVALGTALISTFVAALAGYAISRFKIGGMPFVSWIISVRMLPPIAAALPLYVTFRLLHLLDTWWALILVHLTFTTPFAVWVLISFFNEIPRELDEAAFVDGATPFATFWRVVLPLSAPGLAAMMTLSFVQSWGEFLLALILTSTARAQTLPIYLGRYITGFRVAWGPLAAAGLVTMLPVVVFSLLMQRYLLRGLTFGAVKG
ncbi:MAG: carbohydrate ABC transporter permease [Armatimonadota bacterium]|nr:carbohydrate ABC transporter permease [Armatimonadota bacterium]MDR7558642.1 carbohydrate ABC transporter permease [Armatimonadota bacterium]